MKHGRSVFTRAVLPLLTLSAVALFLLPGCGDEPTRPATATLPAISGAVVPETIEEGQSIDIQIWGTSPEPDWALTGFQVGPTGGDIIEIRPVGRRISGRGLGSAEFSAVATLPPCSAGDRTIRIHGSNGRIDYPIHVLPRDMMVRFSAEGRGGERFEELVITADGWAVAFRRGDVPPVRVSLPREQVARVRQLFRESGFMELENRYVSDPPSDSLRFMIVYRPDRDHRKRVVAEPGLAPPQLLSLVRELHQMAERILQSVPPRPIVTGSLEVRPPQGDVGSARTIVLTLRNRSESPVTLHYPTSQIYDVAILHCPVGDSLRDGHDGDPGEGPGNDSGQGGMHDGGMPGGGGPGHGHHGDSGGLDDPPPMRAVIWNWAYGREFDPTPMELAFQPGEERVYEIEWPGTSNDGGPVPVGAYSVMARIPAATRVPVAPARLIVGAPTPELVLRFAVEPRSAPPGAERTFRLSVGNPGPDPVTLRFGSAQIYDFLLDDPETMMPGWDWRWSDGKAFPLVLTDVTIPAEGRVEYVERWDGTVRSGMPLRPGIYTVQGMLMLPDRPMSAPVTIEVTRR
jgi:hypothetical protein